MTIKVSADELAGFAAGDTTLEFRNGSGYIAEMAAYHELHCIKRIRRHLHFERYYGEVTEDERIREEAHIDVESGRSFLYTLLTPYAKLSHIVQNTAMRFLSLALLFGISLAAPFSKSQPEADDLVHNSWSARNAQPEADADELVHNSWSARDTKPRATDADELVHNSWSARGTAQRRAEAEADELVHNSWSARG
ncbi:MAG: hypothetical protein MMC23_008700 [Stictis urceolatum]|nr:hypothetical protein [Stictis urceolata]